MLRKALAMTAHDAKLQLIDELRTPSDPLRRRDEDVMENMPAFERLAMMPHGSAVQQVISSRPPP
jgi:hypothetical protein